MYNKLEKDLIQTIMSSGQFKLLDIDSELKETTWALQRSLDNVDEIIIFIHTENYNIVKQHLDKYINEYYTGSKGIALHFIVFQRIEGATNTNYNTYFENPFIKNSSLVVIDEKNLDIVYSEGSLNYSNFINLYLKREKSIKESSGISKYPITAVIILINVVIYLIMFTTGGYALSFSKEILLKFGAMSSAYIKSGEQYRLFTAMFIHTGILHIVFNMYSLKSIGELIEKIYGSYKFILIYSISGFFGSVFSFYFTRPSVSAGASGAIFGLLGAALVYGIKMRNKHGRNFYISIFKVILINLIIGITLPNIDNFAHIGGLVGGMAITFIIENIRIK